LDKAHTKALKALKSRAKLGFFNGLTPLIQAMFMAQVPSGFFTPAISHLCLEWEEEIKRS
jgi:hypothetical protein